MTRMLVLTRRAGESLRIGPEVKVTLVSCGGGQARIAVQAPRDIQILREELYERTASANLAAVEASMKVIGSATESAAAGTIAAKEGGK